MAEDPAEALKWFRKAASQGHTEAQRVVGIYYEEGKVVSQDYPEAFAWYRKSAESGMPGRSATSPGRIAMAGAAPSIRTKPSSFS